MGGPVADPSAYQVMTHPMVLECFGAVSRDAGTGLFRDGRRAPIIDVTFPGVLKASRWCALWTEQGGAEEHLRFQVEHEGRISAPCVITVRVKE